MKTEQIEMEIVFGVSSNSNSEYEMQDVYEKDLLYPSTSEIFPRLDELSLFFTVFHNVECGYIISFVFKSG